MKGNMQKLNNTIGNKTNCKRKMRREGKSQSTRNQRGITLVALVITIIVIIILSTVAINFVFGDNGLIRQAEQARDYYANDTEYTDGSLTNVDAYIDEIINGEKSLGESIVNVYAYSYYNLLILNDEGELFTIPVSENGEGKIAIQEAEKLADNVKMADGQYILTYDNQLKMVEGRYPIEITDVKIEGEMPNVLCVYNNRIIDIDGYYWNIDYDGIMKKGSSIMPDKKINIIKNFVIRNNMFVIDDQGNVWGIGSNYDGQLGDGTNEDSDVLKMIDTIDKKIVDIKSDGYDVYALDEEGDVWTWGRNYGSVPQKINEIGNKIISISGAGLALDDERKLWNLMNKTMIETEMEINKIMSYFIIDENENVWVLSYDGNQLDNIESAYEGGDRFEGEKIVNVLYFSANLAPATVFISHDNIIYNVLIP